MSIITITSGIYANAEDIVQTLAKKLGDSVITDDIIFKETERLYGIKQAVLTGVVDGKQPLLNDFTHTREKCLASLEGTLAQFMLSSQNQIIHGLLGHLIPFWVSQVLRVLIIADKKSRIKTGCTSQEIPEKEVIKNINDADNRAFLWTNEIHRKYAWDESLYDIVIPSDKLDADRSAQLIAEQYLKFADGSIDQIIQEINDFDLSARVNLALASLGRGLSTKANKGHVVVTIDRKVLLLSKLEHKIRTLVETVEGVASIETKIGRNYSQPDIIHNFEFNTPSRILLVDDEKEFVQTLSERLKMRQLQSEVVFSGEEALDYTEREDVEVLVLDLKMPGIDGIEVLKRIKQSKPNIEVIILTGHGSDSDRKTCMKLGAFAYLQKPTDIDQITATMKAAYKKINDQKAPSG